MAIGIAGDTPVQFTSTQTSTANVDLLNQILTELRTLTAITGTGLNVIDEPDSYRNDPSNTNPNI